MGVQFFTTIGFNGQISQVTAVSTKHIEREVEKYEL